MPLEVAFMRVAASDPGRPSVAITGKPRQAPDKPNLRSQKPKASRKWLAL